MTTIQTHWKLLIDLPDEALHFLPTIFNFETGRTFMRTLGGRSSLTFNPITLNCTTRFYNLLRGPLQDNGFEGRKFPLTHISTATEYNFKFRLYGKKLLVIEIVRQPIAFTANADLITLTSIWDCDPLSKMVFHIIGLIRSPIKEFKPIGQRPKVFHFNCIIGEPSNLPSIKTSVELLTRHRSPTEMVIKSVVEKNSVLQSDGSTLLIDRQGVVAAIPASYVNDQTVMRRFPSAVNIFEVLACVERMVEKKTLFSLDNSEISDIDFYFANPESRFAYSTSSRNIWLQMASEFQLSSTKWKDIKGKMGINKLTDDKESVILIVTALEEEAAPITAKLLSVKTEPIAGVYISYGRFVDNETTAKIYVFSVGVGNAKAALNTSKLLEALRPNLTIFSGIAGGRKEAIIGSVVVANLAYNYESGKENKKGFFPRPRTISLSPKSESLINAFMANIRNIEKSYDVYFKPIACGEKVLGSSKSSSAVLVESIYGDALAVEMEGYGYLAALELAGYHVNGALIRGISDRLDKKDSEENHELAIANATDLTFKLITFFLAIDPSVQRQTE